MKRLAATTGLLLSLFAGNALAAKAFLVLFYDDAPLRGVTVTLDGVPIGSTDGQGSVSASISAGDHRAMLVDDDIEFPVNFSSGPDEDVEVSVHFTSTAGDEPRVAVRKFGPGEAGASGYITGRITDAAGAPLAGASVSLRGTAYRATTDADGVYVLDVPRGDYVVEASQAGFATASIEGVRVLSGLGVTAAITLRPEGMAGGAGPDAGAALEEVFVLGVFDPQQDATSVERYATSITNAIDVGQLERFGDSDVAAALNRVVGVAVTERKYATVRGLDGRYISSSLNGLLMPSTDPQRRDVQLDLFPTDILGGIEIQKSYTPDQLASTTGGSIKIMTKGLPDERIRKVSGSLDYNTDFTFDEIQGYHGSDSDWTGYDSGLRALPRALEAATDGGRSLTICDPSVDPERCTSPLDAARLGVKLQDDYNVNEDDALPDGSISGAIGDRLPYGDNEWGYYAAASYAYSTDDRGDAELSNPLELSGDYKRSEETVDLNGYLVLGYDYGEADQVLSKTSFLRSTDDTTRVESGFDNQEGNQIDRTILQWVERQFFSQAFTGHNEFDVADSSHLLDWRIAYARTERDEPDRRQYIYFNDNLSTSALERRWSDLGEDSYDFGADYTIPLEWSDNLYTEVMTGVLYSDKDRDVDQYRFGFTLGPNGQDLDLGIDQDLEKDIFPYQNYALDIVRLDAKTADTDSYESTETTQAWYLTTNTEIGEHWSVLAGARFEDFEQQLDYPYDPSASGELQYDDWYPAINLTWRPLEEFQLRAGVSQTVSYPGLIERSEAQSYDPDTDDPIFGNPDLQVSTIDNYDLRGEYYFSETGRVSLALFYKDITDPVERAIPDASGSAVQGTTFINQDSAELNGVELDGTVDVLERDDSLLWVAGNIAWIDSEVTLSDTSLRLEGENADGRELQGQSEWLGNIQVGYDHFPTEQKVTLLLNYFDDRIYRVARGANNGPEYEVERLVVDITYEKIFSEEITLKASIQNLLNEDVEYSQNGNTIESYQTGTLIGVGVSYQF